MEDIFFNPKNESMLDRILYADFKRRTAGDLTVKQKDRLLKTVRHYMNEVYEKNDSSSVQDMNKEVLSLVVPDFSSYLKRQVIQNSSPMEDRLKEDVSSRFSSLQNERTEQKALMPPAPDFRIALDDSDVPAITLYEKAKKNRESEVLAGTMLKDLGVESTPANTNPTHIVPEAPRIRAPLPQDNIIPQDDILSYKENEYNLVLYSADRDWYTNKRENRYNFSITFNPANNGTGYKFSPSANIKFHNIVRIEMVKAIIPNESVDVLIQNSTAAGSNVAFSAATSTSLNVLTLPGIVLHVDELESNVYGTDDTLERAFAMLQYDAQWCAETASPNPGFLAMIPKFLKCQRVYYPTPLATLSKMTIQLQRPNGNLVSDVLDTLDISGIFASSVATLPTGLTLGSSSYISTAAKDTVNNSLYFIIRTTTYFSRFAFAKGDRIQIQGINTSLITGNDSAKSDWLAYIQQSAGLFIVSTGFTSAGTILTDGYNSVGYANYMVVQSRYADPTTGSVLIQPFSGVSTASQTFESAIRNVNFAGARLINLSRQSQITFRIITRDMDSATRIRPNNA